MEARTTGRTGTWAPRSMSLLAPCALVVYLVHTRDRLGGAISYKCWNDSMLDDDCPQVQASTLHKLSSSMTLLKSGGDAEVWAQCSNTATSSSNSSLPNTVYRSVVKKNVQGSAKRWALGCVNSPLPPRPEGARRRDSCNLCRTHLFLF